MFGFSPAKWQLRQDDAWNAYLALVPSLEYSHMHLCNPKFPPLRSMQVSGLKSITAKHLAISCQCLDAFIALHPALLALFTHGVAPPRLNMLMADFGRALQVGNA